jgi:hypothetical protein
MDPSASIPSGVPEAIQKKLDDSLVAVIQILGRMGKGDEFVEDMKALAKVVWATRDVAHEHPSLAAAAKAFTETCAKLEKRRYGELTSLITPFTEMPEYTVGTIDGSMPDEAKSRRLEALLNQAGAGVIFTKVPGGWAPVCDSKGEFQVTFSAPHTTKEQVADVKKAINDAGFKIVYEPKTIFSDVAPLASMPPAIVPQWEKRDPSTMVVTTGFDTDCVITKIRPGGSFMVEVNNQLRLMSATPAVIRGFLADELRILGAGPGAEDLATRIMADCEKLEPRE